ncbi:MAG: alpha/beta fold hydrolase [Ruminococcaceae bacterium]|nr:alpha/beta fold hydrolase [Oscillospiraceae bacterium]
MEWIILPVVLLVLMTALVIFCFCKCFYARNNRIPDPYCNLHGEQYLAVKDKIFECTRKMDEQPYEPVYITSFDGLKLFGRYYHHADGAPLKIIFHGYRGLALRDASGGYTLAKALGYNVIAVDQRAHGKSQGHVITFGIRERRDVLSWIEYANSRFGEKTPILISGVSMGAATVIMAATLPLPKNVCAILADCPYSTPKDIIQKVAADEHFPPRLSYPFIRIAAKLLGGFDLEETSSLEGAKCSTVPILLLHGEDDRFVPWEMSQEIHEKSNGCTTLATFPNAGHGLSYMVAPREYEAACIGFLNSLPALQQEDTPV